MKDNLVRIGLLVISMIYSNQVLSQTAFCDTLYITPEKGKDAYVNSHSTYLNTNFGNTEEFEAQAWTAGGENFVVRSFIDFEFHQIPSNAIITSASLSLFHKSGENHSTLSGSNACYLERIITTWNEQTVTWNNQPTSTNTNYSEIPISTSGTQDFPNIDVTDLVTDIHNDLSNSYGIAIKLQTEEHYRQMYFSSGDSPDVNKRPYVVICYDITSDIEEQYNKENLLIYPNPTSGIITIDIPYFKQIEIYNINGILIKKTNMRNIDLSEQAKGVYFVKIITKENMEIKKIIIE
jgi:hypothetical protein